MSKRIAITGTPRLGKSTLLIKILARLGCRAGGLLTQEAPARWREGGFELLDLIGGEVGTLASIEGVGSRLGRYRIHPLDLENIVAKAVERTVEVAEGVVIDGGRADGAILREVRQSGGVGSRIR